MKNTRPLITLYGVDTSQEGFGNIKSRELAAKTYFFRFESREEAQQKFYEAYRKAYKKFKAVKQAFRDFQKDNDVEIDYHLDGDTHGLNHDMTITFTMDGFEFEMVMNGIHPIYDLDTEPEEDNNEEEVFHPESVAPSP